MSSRSNRHPALLLLLVDIWLCSPEFIYIVIFFLVCFFISIKFQFIQLPALTLDTVSYHVLCCHDIRIFMVLYYGMKCWLAFACICRILCVCLHFLHRCQYCHTRFNALVWLNVNMYLISHRHIIWPYRSCLLTQLFCSPHYVNCVPRVCLEGALPNGVLSFWLHIPNSCSQNVSTSCARCCSCTVVYLGGSYASGALSAFVRVFRHKTLCMYHLSHCLLLVFVFCLINIFSSSSSYLPCC